MMKQVLLNFFHLSHMKNVIESNIVTGLKETHNETIRLKVIVLDRLLYTRVGLNTKNVT